MQNAETVLGVLQDRGSRGLPVERLYRQLFNRQWYLLAYAKIYGNAGAMTPGITGETVDGMSLKRIDEIIEDLRYERYRWTPVRRTYIPKKDGRRRALGIPEWKDKLLQEVLRTILEAYFEPQFSKQSHGFRPNRGCHTALTEISRWDGTKWFIEGDIKGCFDNINHEVLLSMLTERIHDNRFIRLIKHCLKAGYMENWRYERTYSGTPQGGILSPLLSNVYLNHLDRFVAQELIPEYTKGKRRQRNKEYSRVLTARRRARRLKDREAEKELTKQLRRLSAGDPQDPLFRRLKYVRYADDFILGFIGPKAEAEEIKRKLRTFLQEELKLELSEHKTLITHARGERARFLGYEIGTMHSACKLDERGHRSVNGRIWLRVPQDVITAKCQQYMRAGKPIHRASLQCESAFSIVALYQSQLVGLVQYYQLAHNVYHLYRLKGVMERSLTATLAGKFRTTRAKVYRRYQTKYAHPNGKTYSVLEVRVKRRDKQDLVARWGGIEMKRQPLATITDRQPWIWTGRRTELLRRFLADTCEICGSHQDVQVHHVRALKDLQPKGRKAHPKWMKVMAARRRKTLVVCSACHQDIHAGRDPQWKVGK